LKELGDKVDAESRTKVESALETLKKAVERNDTAEIRSASEALTSVWNEVSSKLYAEASKGQGGQEPPQGEPQGPPMSFRLFTCKEQLKPRSGGSGLFLRAFPHQSVAYSLLIV